MARTTSPHPVVAQLLETSFEGVSVHDEARRVCFANAALGALLGRGADALLGTDASDYAHPEDVHELQRAFHEAVATRRQRLVRYRVVDATGTSRPVESVVVNFVDQPLIGGIVLRTRPHQIAGKKTAERIAELEQRLRRIAREIEASGVVRAVKTPSNSSAMPTLEGLSIRQWEVVARLRRGERVPTIAREMFLSASTVRNHLTTIFRKVGVHSQAELIEYLRAADDVWPPK